MLEFGFEEPPEVVAEQVPIPAPSVRLLESDGSHGVFVIEPLKRGYGTTIGTPLRRMLISSIPGTAVTWVRIDGIQHEYSTVPHVKEDVVDILLNIKAIHLRSLSDRPGKLRLEADGQREVCAGDIMTSSDFEIVNSDMHIATLDNSQARLVIEMNVEQGTGYHPAESQTGLPIGVLPVDAVFTPVTKVNFSVERTRIGQHTDFERLILEIWTNGTVLPAEAMRLASQELIEHLFPFSTFNEANAEDGDMPAWAAAIPATQYNMAVESLNLSVRTLNCLKRASIHKVGEVLEKGRAELLKIRNFGEKSLTELNDKLLELGIQHPGFQADSVTEDEEEGRESTEGESLSGAAESSDSEQEG
jgi:DNA-directed RNA polymerase subunit alpha